VGSLQGRELTQTAHSSNGQEPISRSIPRDPGETEGTVDIDPKERMSLLKDEYFFLQNQYEDYDRRSLMIKGWVSAGATAALALSFGSSQAYSICIPIIIAAVSGIFWYLEAYWKLFQYALSDRIRIIEAEFRDDPEILIKNTAPLQAYNWWFRTYVHDDPIFPYETKSRPRSKRERLKEAASQRFVCLPYLAFIVLSAISLVILVVHRLLT
jgi:hypothetical protein